MKGMIAAAATYAVFIKEAFIIMFKDVTSIIDSNNQMIDEAFISVISTRISVISIKSILLISIDLLLKRVLFNDITIYDTKAVASQLIIAMYDYLNI